MQYAVEREDGGVTIMVLIPTHTHDGKYRWKIGLIVQMDDGTYEMSLGRQEPKKDIATRIEEALLGTPPEPTEMRLTGVAVGWKKDGWTFEFEKPEAVIAKYHPSRRAQVKKVVPIPEALPHTRLYRDAWNLKDDQLSVDMTKAREIHRDYMRRTRGPKLTELDGLHSRALALGNQQEAEKVEAKRQALRDVTRTGLDPKTNVDDIDRAQYPDDLMAVWPEQLLGEHPIMQEEWQGKRRVTEANFATLPPLIQAAMQKWGATIIKPPVVVGKKQ